VSVVDCIMAPLRTSSRRKVSPLGEMPLWPTAKPTALSSANSGCTLRRMVFAGRGIADMGRPLMCRQPVDHGAAGKGVADEAEPSLAVKPGAVEGNDARGLLAAMLQGVQSKRCDRSGIGWPKMPNTPHSSRNVSPSRSESCRSESSKCGGGVGGGSRFRSYAALHRKGSVDSPSRLSLA